MNCSIENFRYFSYFCSKHRLWIQGGILFIDCGFKEVYFSWTCFGNVLPVDVKSSFAKIGGRSLNHVFMLICSLSQTSVN